MIRKCWCCKTEKPLTAFSKYAADKLGRNRACKICVREQHRLLRYGVSREEYNVLFAEQEGRCAICQKHQSESPRSFAGDHSHKTGKIRGLLCQKCNIAIGHLDDRIDLLDSAKAYLQRAE